MAHTKGRHRRYCVLPILAVTIVIGEICWLLIAHL
jgi:hypothetical protein